MTTINSQGARFLKIDLAQLSSQKRFDIRNGENYPSTKFLGTSYSQIVVAVFKEESFCTPTPFLLYEGGLICKENSFITPSTNA